MITEVRPQGSGSCDSKEMVDGRKLAQACATGRDERIELESRTPEAKG